MIINATISDQAYMLSKRQMMPSEQTVLNNTALGVASSMTVLNEDVRSKAIITYF